LQNPLAACLNGSVCVLYDQEKCATTRVHSGIVTHCVIICYYGSALLVRCCVVCALIVIASL